MTTKFELSYVPLIGKGSIERHLTIDRTKLQKKPLHTFAIAPRFNYSDSNDTRPPLANQRSTKKISRSKHHDVDFTATSPKYTFTKSGRFNGIRESDFCLANHTLSFSSVRLDEQAWQKGFHMDKVEPYKSIHQITVFLPQTCTRKAYGKGIGRAISVDYETFRDHPGFKQQSMFSSRSERFPEPRPRSPGPGTYLNGS
jgi:hypothetical protein